MRKAALNFLMAVALAEINKPTPPRYEGNGSKAGNGPNKAFTIPEYWPTKKDLKRKKPKP